MRLPFVLWLVLVVGCDRAEPPTAAATDTVPQDSAASALPGDLRITEARPGLLRRAAIPPARAVREAMGAFPGSDVANARIMEVGGRLVFRVALRRGAETRFVLVDARTGAVLASAYTGRRER